MDPAEILRILLLSTAVFLPVLALSGALVFLATRRIADAAERRRQRTLLALACVALALIATARFWAANGLLTNPDLYRRLLLTIGVPLGVYLLVVLAVRWVYGHVQDDASRLKLRKTFIYVGVLIVAVTLVNVWLVREQVNYTMVFSVLGAGLALALHQVLMCATGWVLLQAQRHYDVGDRVQIGDVRGDVSDIGILHTTLVEIGNWVNADQSTGRLVTVPNSYVITQPVYNYTREFDYIWNEISVLVTFESNWRKAQELMLGFAQQGAEEIQEKFRAQAQRMARKYMFLYHHAAPIVYPRILDSGVQLTLRYLVHPKSRRGSEAEITAQILDAFAREPDVEFAYPTTRFYDATQEDKAAVPPPATGGAIPPAQ